MGLETGKGGIRELSWNTGKIAGISWERKRSKTGI